MTGRARTSVSMASVLVGRGRGWCERRRLGFGVLLEEALAPVLELPPGDLVAEPGAREVVGIRIDAVTWEMALALAGGMPAAPGVLCDHALRLYLPEPPDVPWDLSGARGSRP